jgi:hypothetical protein
MGLELPKKRILVASLPTRHKVLILHTTHTSKKVEARERRINSRALLTGEGSNNRTVREVKGSIEQEN